MKCKNCKHEMSITVHDKSKNKVIINNKYKWEEVFATFECRKVILKKWVFEEGIGAKGINIKISSYWHNI